MRLRLAAKAGEVQALAVEHLARVAARGLPDFAPIVLKSSRRIPKNLRRAKMRYRPTFIAPNSRTGETREQAATGISRMAATMAGVCRLIALTDRSRSGSPADDYSPSTGR